LNKDKILVNKAIETCPVESENHTPLEHQNVPTAHQGLHSFLYSSDDEHTSTLPSLSLENDGFEIVAVEAWQAIALNAKVAGVYAVLDCDRIYQYIGYSRDVLRSLKGHLAENGAEICAFIRVQTFKFPKRQAMEELRDQWIETLDCVPPGNQGKQGTWASTIGEAAKATMSAAERDAYENKKLKLRKAMADNTLIDELEKNDTQKNADNERRRKLEAAVKNDDWSSVIESQSE